MKFTQKDDFELSQKSHFVFELGNIESKSTIPQNEIEQAKVSIKKQLDALEQTNQEPKNWKIDKQLQFLLELSKNESVLDNDENSIWNRFKDLFKVGETPSISELITQFSDEALLAFITVHKKKARSLFTTTEGTEKTVDFFGIDFLERNVSALDLLETEDQYLCIKGRSGFNNTYFIRQSDGYLQVKPKTNKKQYARIGSTTKFEVLSKEDFEDKVSEAPFENLESSKEIEANEKIRIQNYQFYQTMKLSLYHLRDEHPKFVNSDKLDSFLRCELDDFYQKNKYINPQKFNLSCNDLIKEKAKDLFTNDLNFDDLKRNFDVYLNKIEENNNALLAYNRTQISLYLKTINSSVNVESHLDKFLNKVDSLKDFSEEDISQYLVEIAVKFPDLTKNEQNEMSKTIFDLLKSRKIIDLQKNSNELFINSAKVKLEQIKVNKEKEKLEKTLEEQKKEIRELFEAHPEFCEKLGISIVEDLLNASVKDLLEFKTNFLETPTFSTSNEIASSKNKKAFFIKFDSLVKTQSKIETSKINIKNLDENLFRLHERLAEIESNYVEKANILESQNKVFETIEASIGGKNDFFVSVQKAYEKEKTERTEIKKVFKEAYADQINQLDSEKQKKQEAFVNDFIESNPPGVKVIDFNETGPILSVGEGKQEIQYDLKENNFSVVGLEDYNEDYLKFPAKPESLPKLQIIASFKEANYFTSDAGISKDAKGLGSWELKDFFNNYLGVFAGNRLQQPDELDGWKNLMIESRKRGHGLRMIMEKLGVLNKNDKTLQGEKGNIVRPKIDELLEAARVGNKRYIDLFFDKKEHLKI